MTDNRIDLSRHESEAHAEQLDADEDALLTRDSAEEDGQPAAIDADDDLAPAR